MKDKIWFYAPVMISAGFVGYLCFMHGAWLPVSSGFLFGVYFQDRMQKIGEHVAQPDLRGSNL